MTVSERRPRIGVLAIQGDFEAHAKALARAGADAVLVREPKELDGLDGLVLPGGETGRLKAFEHAPDGSSWRYTLEFRGAREG